MHVDDGCEGFPFPDRRFFLMKHGLFSFFRFLPELKETVKQSETPKTPKATHQSILTEATDTCAYGGSRVIFRVLAATTVTSE